VTTRTVAPITQDETSPSSGR